MRKRKRIPKEVNELFETWEPRPYGNLSSLKLNNIPGDPVYAFPLYNV